MDKEAVGKWAADCWNSALARGLIDSGHTLVLETHIIDPDSISRKADSAYVSMKKGQTEIRIRFMDASKETVMRVIPGREGA